MATTNSILIVDDEPLVATALARQLEGEAQVDTVGSVGEALLLLAQHHYDFVVTDLRMPGRWGDELLAYVAARFPETRRVIYTGDPDAPTGLRELIDQGIVQAVVVKPDHERLIAVLTGKSDAMVLEVIGAARPARREG